jgi:hypothetical protein
LQDYSSGGSKWIIDSGCTNHMTGDKNMFFTYERNSDPSDSISFGDNSQGRIVGLGNIPITSDYTLTKVFHVDTLDYNLLSVSQLCKMGYKFTFTDEGVIIYRKSDGSIAFKGMLKGKLYVVDFTKHA